MDANFNAARSARLAASESFQAAADVVYEWLLAVSNVLASRFGTRWSTAWAQAGFINHSTGIPSKVEERLGLGLSLVKFFTANPTFQVPSMNLTAAQGTTLRNAALTAQGTVTTATVALNTIGDAWQTAYDMLVGAMRALIKNLEGKLAKNDPRWLAFGLNMPAASSTPGKPVNVTAQVDETGAIHGAVRRGGAGEAVSLADADRGGADGLPTGGEHDGAGGGHRRGGGGQTVQITVQAVNGSQQGVASEPITFTVPAAKSAGFRNLSTTEEIPAFSTESNGHGSGNGNARRVAVA